MGLKRLAGLILGVFFGVKIRFLSHAGMSKFAFFIFIVLFFVYLKVNNLIFCIPGYKYIKLYFI